jgi:hypothetical protein
MSRSEKIITIILVVCMICLTAIIDVEKRKAEKELTFVRTKLDSLQHVSDSLEDEVLYQEIKNGRYETAYQILLRRNPKAAEQYGNIISEETE